MAKKQKKKTGSSDTASAATKSKSKPAKSSDGEEKVDEWTAHSAKKQRKMQKQKKKLEQQEQQRREEELLQAPQMSLPLNLNNPPVMQTPMEGPAFLDTIPEDTSVAAGAGVIHRPALSTASAVASADSDDEEQAKGNKKSGSDLSNGATLGDDDASARRRKAKKQAKKKTQALMFYALVGVLVVGVAIGIVFLLKFGKSRKGNQGSSPSPSPANYTLSPDSIWLESESPTSVPIWDAQDIQELDDALLEVTPEERSFAAVGTPQATCRDWFLRGSVFHSNFTVQLMGKERVQQRYILCVLYHSAGGEFWDTTGFVKSANYLNANADECEWDGVICPEESTTVSGIYLQNANLTGSLPEELVHMKHITYLRIYDNAGLVGTIPSNLLSESSLPELVTLDLSNNSLTGTIPEPSRVPDNLKNVFLNDNDLSGRIPFLGSNLKRLYAYNNALNEFPSDQYASIPTLKSVLIFNNFLTGTLSQTVWETPKLEVFDVAGNSFVGRVPESLWQLTNLKDVILNDNQFRDSLPPRATIGKAFENVWLHSNEFAGTIPASLGVGWSNLTSLRLQDNNLSGAIPCNNFLAVDSATFELEADCALPNLACDCCTCYPN